jgi:site-specific DNA-methyltransferase (adenine-specific)
MRFVGRAGGRAHHSAGGPGRCIQSPTWASSAAISARGLNKSVNDVACLIETIGREKAALGILIAAAMPTPKMEKRAAAAGFFDTGMGQQVPRIQIITLAEIFAGNRPVIRYVNAAMFKAAPVEEKTQQGRLL